MNQSKIFYILLLAIFILGIAGCQQATPAPADQSAVQSTESQPSASNKEAQKFHFILVNNMTTLPHFGPTYDGVDLAVKEISEWTGDEITYEIVGPTENDVLKEAEALEASIAKKPDGILTIVWDPGAMTAPINKAVEAGIPVITIDADAPDSKRLLYIGTDWVQTGIALAHALAAAIGEKGQVAMVGLISLPQQQTAFESFRKTMEDNYPNVEVVGLENDNSQETEAARVASALMTKYPDLVGIAGFDNASGTGISTAVREAGKSGKVKVVGNDMNVPQLQAIKDGTQQFALGQKFKVMGYWGVLSMYIQLKSNFTFTEDDQLANIQKLPPRIVTGFLAADESNADLYMSAFEKYTK